METTILSLKAKRHKKRPSRTQVSSSSDSEPEAAEGKTPQKKLEKAASSKPMTNAEVAASFTKYYLKRATTELSEDLDSIRGAGDFKGDALSLLINCLQQGAAVLSTEEQRRVVEAGPRND